MIQNASVTIGDPEYRRICGPGHERICALYTEPQKKCNVFKCHFYMVNSENLFWGFKWKCSKKCWFMAETQIAGNLLTFPETRCQNAAVFIVMERDAWRGQSIMVWAAIGLNRRTEYHVFQNVGTGSRNSIIGPDPRTSHHTLLCISIEPRVPAGQYSVPQKQKHAVANSQPGFEPWNESRDS